MRYKLATDKHYGPSESWSFVTASALSKVQKQSNQQ